MKQWVLPHNNWLIYDQDVKYMEVDLNNMEINGKLVWLCRSTTDDDQLAFIYLQAFTTTPTNATDGKKRAF